MTLKILVLDDDKATLDVIHEILSAEFYLVECCDKIESFWQHLKAQKPDLCLVDCLLEDGNGLDICKLLKSEVTTKHIPVVLFTSCTKEDIEGMSPACDDIIYKPPELTDLIRRIQAILSH